MRSTLSFLVVLLSTSASAYPKSCNATRPGKWTSLPPIPTGPFQEHTSAAINNSIFIIGGIDPFNTSPPNFPSSASVLAYSIPNNTWGTAAPLPLAMNHVNSAVVGDKIYVIGGMISNVQPVWAAVPDCFVYDPTTDKWAALPPMPTDQARGASAIGVSGNTIFVAGGLKSLALSEGGLQESVDTVTAYDTLTGVWTVLPSLPAPRDHVGGAVVGGEFFVIGGRDHGKENVRDTLWAMDVKDVGAGWRARSPLPTARGGLSVGVIRQTIVTFGGEGNPASESGVFNETEAYDVRRNAWRKLGPMAVPRHGTSAASAGSKIYIPGGGIVQAGGPVDLFDVFEL